MSKVHIDDARMQWLPGQGWVMVVTWSRRTPAGKVVREVEEILSVEVGNG